MLFLYRSKINGRKNPSLTFHIVQVSKGNGRNEKSETIFVAELRNLLDINNASLTCNCFADLEGESAGVQHL